MSLHARIYLMALLKYEKAAAGDVLQSAFWCSPSLGSLSLLVPLLLCWGGTGGVADSLVAPCPICADI